MQEEWNRISWWYRQAKGRHDPLPREGLYWITTERAELYMCSPPERLQIPILVTPAAVHGRSPLESEIDQAVRDLKRGIAGGPYVI